MVSTSDAVPTAHIEIPALNTCGNMANQKILFSIPGDTKLMCFITFE